MTFCMLICICSSYWNLLSVLVFFSWFFKSFQMCNFLNVNNNVCLFFSNSFILTKTSNPNNVGCLVILTWWDELYYRFKILHYDIHCLVLMGSFFLSFLISIFYISPYKIKLIYILWFFSPQVLNQGYASFIKQIEKLLRFSFGL